MKNRSLWLTPAKNKLYQEVDKLVPMETYIFTDTSNTQQFTSIKTNHWKSKKLLTVILSSYKNEFKKSCNIGFWLNDFDRYTKDIKITVIYGSFAFRKVSPPIWVEIRDRQKSFLKYFWMYKMRTWIFIYFVGIQIEDMF